MGVRSFLKEKLDKHGGPGGLATHAVKKAMGRPSSPAASGPAAPVDIKDAFENLPKKPDAQGFWAVAPSALLPEGGTSTFKAGEVPVACFRIDGKIYVIDDECTHENGPLGEGKLEGFVVTCPYHDWRFDIRTGDCLTEKDRFVSCFSVKEKDGLIWVGKRTREGSAGRGGDHDDGLVTLKLPADS